MHSLLSSTNPGGSLAVVPVLVGPLQALMAVLPGILVALGGLVVAMFKPSALKRLAQLLWSQKLIVLAIAAAGWGVIHLSGTVFSGMENISAAELGSKAGWPMWRGGTSRRGYAPGAEDPAHGNVVWSFSRDGIKTFYSSPSVVGNRVFATSARWELFKKDGAIYGIEADTGRLVWEFASDGYRATFSSPAVSGKYLVVGEGLHLTEDARVFCLDLEQSEEQREGVKLWSYRTGSHVESSPAVAEGKAVIGAGGDGVYCFALEPDAEGEARVLWHLPGENYPDCETSPIIHDGKVYFGLGLGGQAVCCVDAETGAELWRVETPYPAFGSPSLADGKLYVGMGHGDFVNTAEAVARNRRDAMAKEGRSQKEIEEAVGDIRPVGALWCLDPNTGAVNWRAQVGRTVLGAAAVDGDRVYFGSRDGHLYCVGTDGRRIGRWNAHAPIVTAPAVAERHVYVMTESGDLYGLDKRSLQLVWNVSLNSPSMSSPAVARGHVYVGTTNNGLMCVGQPGRPEREPLWPGARGGAGRTGNVDGSLLPQRGAYAWRFADPLEPAKEAGKPPSIDAPVACVDRAVYVGYNQEPAAAFGLARFNVGESLAEQPTPAWYVESTNPVHLSPAATRGRVFFVDGRPGDADRALRCVDAETGRVLWKRPVETGAAGEFTITRERVFVADRTRGLTCLDADSSEEAEVIWSADAGSCVGAPTLLGDLLFVAAKSPPSLLAMDAATGKVLWNTRLGSAPRSGPVPAGRAVWLDQADGLRGYGMVDGQVEHTVDCRPVPGTLAGNETRVVCRDEGGELLIVDAATGRVAKRLEGAVGKPPPLVTEDGLLYLAEGALHRYDFQTAEDRLWARIRPSWPGLPSSPLIMVDSHVLFGTDTRGLVCMKPKQR